MLRKASLLIVALVMLAGCGGGAPAASPSSAAGSASASSSPASAAPSGSASAASASASAEGSPAGSPEASGSAGASTAPSGSAAAVIGELGVQGQIALQAIVQLAAQTGVQASDLQVQSAEATEWSDGSLGCPDPATSYIQVITPGYKIVLSDGTRTYNIHASQQGNVVWCDNGTPKPLAGS